MECFALLDDCTASTEQPSSRLYTGFVGEHRCDDPDELDAVWAAAGHSLRSGRHAVVVADYEWGVRLQGGERDGDGERGALRFLLFENLAKFSAADADAWLAAREADALSEAAELPAPAGVLDVRPSVNRSQFEEAIASIHAAIGEGETYQVNYTYRMDFQSFGLPVSLYRRLRARQPVPYGAFIALPPGPGATHILSCSPELFLSHHDRRLVTRPMKGTASRAAVPEGDSEIARMLGEDAKNRAENLMIVDLLRNDLGRIARTGSVSVPALFSVESYSTVFQMTSTVEGELPAATAFPDILRALFPCGSITGAPKHRTMQLIADLETTPRDLYTGSIGWVEAPDAGHADAACGDFCLSVAIRTVTLAAEEEGGLWPGRMGVGAGIVIDSRAADEFEECALKARFLTALDPGFALIESIYASRIGGIRHLDRHLSRLSTSAAELGFTCSLVDIERALRGQLAALTDGAPVRLRLALRHDGRFDLTMAPLESTQEQPVGLLLDEMPIDAGHPLRRHKTSLRGGYDAAIVDAGRRGAFDTLFVTADGRLTEGARSNLFLRIEGQWLTPPLSAGILPGIMRGVLLDDPVWAAREAELTVADLGRAELIMVCNALRGPLIARLVGRARRDCGVLHHLPADRRAAEAS